MVVQLHLEGIPCPPGETDPPAARYTNAVLSGAVSPEAFKPITGWYSKVFYRSYIVDSVQLALRSFQKSRRERPVSYTIEDIRGALVGKRPDHALEVLCSALYVKRIISTETSGCTQSTDFPPGKVRLRRWQSLKVYPLEPSDES